MKKPNTFLGGVLLIGGTSIGAGMLGLPVVTAFAGFWPSIFLFAGCWLFMFVTAWFFLDVALSMPGQPNLISMAGKTLGFPGKLVSWIFYLLLLYSLLAAYISGSSALFAAAIASFTGYLIPNWLAAIAMPILFGGFIYLGTLGIDYLNRLLMLGLVLAYVALSVLIPPYFHFSYLEHRDFPALTLAATILFTSFGYHIIIPSLATYMQYNKKLLRRALLIGSLIPLVIYLSWQLLIQASIPFQELILSWQQGEPATIPLARLLKNPVVGLSARFFSFFAIITSFLGVALSLCDFLSDGLKIKKNWKGRILTIFLSFFPPLVFVFVYEKGFYFALQHAGAVVAVLLGILPAAMAWTLKGASYKWYSSWRGRLVMALVIGVSFGVFCLDILNSQHLLDGLTSKYLIAKDQSALGDE